MLNYILYYLIIYPVSKLPFFLLYRVSDFLFVLAFYVVGYRKKVVFNNLKNAFPEKSIKELKSIQKAFYQHFCDLIVESVKAFTISEKEANQRMTYTGLEYAADLAKKNKNIIIIGGHYANWELLAITVNNQFEHQVQALYTPIKNIWWENKMKESRSRFGLKMVGIKQVKTLFKTGNSALTATIFGSDQSPRNPEKAYWTTFLNQETGIQFGAEKYAKETNSAVIFGAISKIKRGYYTTHFTLLYEESENLQHGEVLESYSKNLEAQIKADPRYYLWTHKRWKHQRPEGM